MEGFRARVYKGFRFTSPGSSRIELLGMEGHSMTSHRCGIEI